MANHDLHRNIAMVGLSPSPYVLTVSKASKASKVPPGHQPPCQHQESDLAAVVSRWDNSIKSHDDRDDP